MDEGMAERTNVSGYDPFETDNKFMESWYEAACGAPPRIHPNDEDLRGLAGVSSYHDMCSAKDKSRVHYGSYQGLPNEWFYEFAKTKKREFEEHVRSIGYEVDLAATPGLGKLSQLPHTPEYLETIIPPACNQDVSSSNPYFEYMFANADGDGMYLNGDKYESISSAEGLHHSNCGHEQPRTEPFLDFDPVNHFEYNSRPGSQACPGDSGNDDQDTAFSAEPNNSIENLSFGKVSEERATEEKSPDPDTSYSREGGHSSLDINNAVTKNAQSFCLTHPRAVCHSWSERHLHSDVAHSGFNGCQSPVQDTLPKQNWRLASGHIAWGKAQALENCFQSFAAEEELHHSHFHPGIHQQNNCVNHYYTSGNANPSFGQPNNPSSYDLDVDRRCINPINKTLVPEKRTILKAVSQKQKFTVARASSQPFPDLADVRPPSFIAHRQRKNKARPPLPINTENLSTEDAFREIAKERAITRKRLPDNTFPTRSAAPSPRLQTKVQCSKKVRSDEWTSAVTYVKQKILGTEIRGCVAPTPKYADWIHITKRVQRVGVPTSSSHNVTHTSRASAAFKQAIVQQRDVPEIPKLFGCSLSSAVYHDSPSIIPVSVRSRFSQLPTPLTDRPPAYPGQFHGISLHDLYTLGHQTMNIENQPLNPLSLTFGDRLHPNPLITHPAIPEHPSTLPIGSLNYTHHTLPPTHHLHSHLDYLSHTVDLSASSPVAMHRTQSQETLRIEIHRELAAARLEGFHIGEYRYYQGHLSVEEYIDKGMCVCWSACGCSGWCSRFGDLICPCNQVLKIEEAEDGGRDDTTGSIKDE